MNGLVGGVSVSYLIFNGLHKRLDWCYENDIIREVCVIWHSSEAALRGIVSPTNFKQLKEGLYH